MSGQAGALYFDRRPVPRTDAESARSRLAPLGPDGDGLHTEASLFMAHRALHITPEDRGERQPHHGRDFVMTWDGRLDNRHDLLLALGAPARTPDVDIVSRAYELWGLDALPRLIGDWSCAIWDRTARQIHLASDYMGSRALYWQKTGTALRWSTTLDTFPRETLTLNDEYILGFLMLGAPPDSTPYRDVLSLSPGHVLTCTATGVVSQRRFYEFPRERLEYRDERDYEARFRELLAEAVGRRMHASGPVWAELSGGFDSSSIVCMAAALIDQGRVTAPSFHTVSCVTDDSPESTEERFIDAVLDATGVPGTKLELSLFDSRPDPDPAFPKHRSAAIWSVCRRMRREGARVLLSGRLGDGVTGNSRQNFPAILEPLLRGRPLACLAEARSWSLSSRLPVIEVLYRAAQALSSGRRFGALQTDSAILNYGGTGDTTDLAELFSLARPVDKRMLEHVIEYAVNAASSGPPWRQQVLSSVCRYSMRRSLSSWTPEPTVLYSYPYGHRPLVEFVLAIPSRILVGPGEPRRLMRRALAGLLPPRILRRFSKGYAAPQLARSFRPTAQRLRDSVETLRLVELGYIDKDRLRDRLTHFLSGADAKMGNLWHLAVLEEWLASIEMKGIEMKGGETRCTTLQNCV